MQELVQGIGRLVIKLNESVLKVDKRLESLEKGLSELLEGNFKAVTSELARSNELLSSISGAPLPQAAAEAGPESPVSPRVSDQTEGMIVKLDELREELAGLRKDLGESEVKLLKALADGPEDSVGRELFSSSLSDISVMVSESSKSLEETISRIVVETEGNRSKAISDSIGTLSGDLRDISGKMDKAREAIESTLEEIKTETAREVSAIHEKVAETASSQTGELEKMKELLALHSVEVQDNRVRDLNRRAIVHFNNAEYGQAMSDLREALELSPESPELLANMAHIEASRGNLKEAEEHFRKALELDPKLEPAISGLGTLMVITGRPEDGIDFLQNYLEEGSGSSTGVMIALSRAYAAQENHAKALELLERAQQTAPGHPELEQELAKYRK
ncbi:MAG: hypothetical protein AVO35_05030 [Candidatus Aegiribacteria sp. MLS_C]|nr:MAG: hypothetical protein AVO35_05030 [Candidatus Aegiribacteria sp. MLS_C]